jgi:hypothetical protein
MSLQHDDQFLIDAVQTLGLNPSQMELPEQNGASQQHREDYEDKAERQTGTDVESMKAKRSLASLLRPSGKFRDHR